MHPYVHSSTIHKSETWTQSKYSLADEQLTKVWCIHMMEYHAAIKENEIIPFAATWMQLEIIILSEVSQKEKDKYHMVSLMCATYNMTQVNLAARQTRGHREQTCVAKGSEVGRDGEGGWGKAEVITVYRMDTQQSLTVWHI